MKKLPHLSDLRKAIDDIASYSGEGPMTTPWQSIVKDMISNAKNALVCLDKFESASNDDVNPNIDSMKSELDEADRRAGSAERKNADLQDTINRNSMSMSQMKKQAGFSENVSFDIVWEKTLKQANQLPMPLVATADMIEVLMKLGVNADHAWAAYNELFRVVKDKSLAHN